MRNIDEHTITRAFVQRLDRCDNPRLKEVLIALDVPSWDVETSVARFQVHDEKLLTRQHAIYHDETQLIQASKDAAQELEDLLEQDRDDASDLDAQSAPFSPSDVR